MNYKTLNEAARLKEIDEAIDKALKYINGSSGSENVISFTSCIHFLMKNCRPDFAKRLKDALYAEKGHTAIQIARL